MLCECCEPAVMYRKLSGHRRARRSGPCAVKVWAAVAVLALAACGNGDGWTVLDHKSKMTDEHEYSVVRASAEEFTNDRNPGTPKWRVQLEVKLYPRLEVVLWTGYEAQEWAGNAEIWYRLDGSPADKIAVRVETARETFTPHAAPAISFPRSNALAALLLRSSELKVGYRQIGSIDQVATFNLKGLQGAIEKACTRSPTTFDCSAGPVRRALDGALTARPSCTAVGIHVADLLRAERPIGGANRLELIDTMMAACGKDPHTPEELSCIIAAKSTAAMGSCAGK